MCNRELAAEFHTPAIGRMGLPGMGDLPAICRPGPDVRDLSHDFLPPLAGGFRSPQAGAAIGMIAAAVRKANKPVGARCPVKVDTHGMAKIGKAVRLGPNEAIFSMKRPFDARRVPVAPIPS